MKIKDESLANIDQRHEAEFPDWFKRRVKQQRRGQICSSDQIYSLACGPDQRVQSYAGCVLNGSRFHTKKCDAARRTRNSGVVSEMIYHHLAWKDLPSTRRTRCYLRMMIQILYSILTTIRKMKTTSQVKKQTSHQITPQMMTSYQLFG
ncbi:hypothetical protein CJ030_MR7G017423 [Morella rubra]|uniref:Uncharacterized protein n=1 Tax=Morella rubra TaxID=262757 RepID=A0A6A1V3W0_9ROSI|nr:hypothetical protein CJ030_MR7G017423 [Morella rubra]